MNYREHGKRIARDLDITKRAKWGNPGNLKKQLSKLGKLSLSQRDGPLHDRYYMIYREIKAAIGIFANKVSLRMAGKIPYIQWLLREYLTLCRGKIEEGGLQEFLYGAASEKGLEEAELILLRPFLAGLLIAWIEDAPDNPELFESVRLLSRIPFETVQLSLSPLEAILSRSESYADMNPRTKAAYRHAIAVQSRKIGMSEWDYAEKLLSIENEKHTPVGTQLFPRYGMGQYPAWYLPLICSLTAILFAGVLLWLCGFWCALAAFPLIYECAMRIVRKRSSRDFLFGMDFGKGIPPDEAALCVVTTLLHDTNDVEPLVNLLEEHFLREQKSGQITFPTVHFPSHRKKRLCRNG